MSARPSEDRFSEEEERTPSSLSDDGGAPRSSRMRLRRRVQHAENVGWRRVVALFAAFLTVLILLGLTGGRAKRLAAARWVGQAILGARAGPQQGLDPNSEVGRLEFAEGRAELGQFMVKIYEPVARRSLRAEFKLEGMTDCEDKKAFQEFMTRNYRFFREQVTIAIRTSSTRDLADPEHRVLRKRILARVNRSLRRDFLTDVELSGFTLHESIGESSYQPIGGLGMEEVLKEEEAKEEVEDLL